MNVENNELSMKLMDKMKILYNSRTKWRSGKMDKKWTDPNIMSEHFINFIIKDQPFNFDAFKSTEEYERYVEEVKEFCERENS